MSTAEVRLARQVKTAKLIEDAHAHADRVLARARKLAIPKAPPPGKSKEARREERNGRAAEIRAAVMARAKGRCEWCGREHFTLEWHHLRSGGERRSAESIENTCAICWDCHRSWERNDPSAFVFASAWAVRLNFVDARKVINRRMEKAMEARSPTYASNRIEVKP